LQDFLNAKASAKEPSAVVEMTQAEYVQRSKGRYARFETMELRKGGLFRPPSDMWSSADRLPLICKIRGCSHGVEFHSPYRIVVITDKPQKPLPDWRTSEAVTS